MKYKLFLSALSVFCIFTLVHGQRTIRNLGFEDLDTNGNLISWSMFWDANHKYFMSLDTAVFFEGKCSFIVSSYAEENRGYLGGSSIFKLPDLGGKKTFKVTAYLKTEDVRNGELNLGVQIDGADGLINKISLDEKAPKGTTNWTKYSLEIPITFDTKSISFGFGMNGTGKGWIDKFEIFVDGLAIE